MSTLYVDDVAGQGGGTATNLMDGLVKQRAFWNGTGTAALYADSVNSASITDLGTGNYTLTATSAFAASDPSVTFGNEVATLDLDTSPAPTTADTTVVSRNISAALTDGDWQTMNRYGDLA